LERSAELATGGHDMLAAQRDLVASIFPKIIVAPQTLSLSISNRGLRSALGVPAQETAELLDTAIDLPFTLRRRRVETKLVLAGERQMPSVDPKLIETIAQAHEWRDRLIEGIPVGDPAREIGLDDGENSRVTFLAFLSPLLIATIVHARQPVDLTDNTLKRLHTFQ